MIHFGCTSFKCWLNWWTRRWSELTKFIGSLKSRKLNHNEKLQWARTTGHRELEHFTWKVLTSMYNSTIKMDHQECISIPSSSPYEWPEWLHSLANTSSSKNTHTAQLLTAGRSAICFGPSLNWLPNYYHCYYIHGAVQLNVRSFSGRFLLSHRSEQNQLVYATMMKLERALFASANWKYAIFDWHGKKRKEMRENGRNEKNAPTV